MRFTGRAELNKVLVLSLAATLLGGRETERWRGRWEEVCLPCVTESFNMSEILWERKTESFDFPAGNRRTRQNEREE